MNIYRWHLTISTQNDLCSQRQVLQQTKNTMSFISSHLIIIINPLTARVVGAPQMISRPGSSTALWDLANSRPVHSLMLSSRLFLCLPYLLSPLTVPCKMVLARPDERDTLPYHCSLRLFTMVRSSYGPIAGWILAWILVGNMVFVTEMRSILR